MLPRTLSGTKKKNIIHTITERAWITSSMGNAVRARPTAHVRIIDSHSHQKRSGVLFTGKATWSMVHWFAAQSLLPSSCNAIARPRRQRVHAGLLQLS